MINLCVICAGRSRDPVRAGAFGASEKPAHQGAEENPQRGQLTVSVIYV